jgi:hypothetical protein
MRRTGPLVVVLTATLTAPSAAAGATLETLSRCYQERSDVVAIGSGFAPNSAITIMREGTNIGTASTNVQGAFVRRFPTPRLPAATPELHYDLVASDGTNSAMVRYRATKVLADVSPASGALETLRVRFRVRGFNLLAASSSVYLHYVRPNGTLRRTIRLGTARGSCGHIIRTKRRSPFPFDAQRGRWTLQFETRKQYTRGSATSRFVWVRKPVQIFGG